jgi:hypothetical protein
MVRATGAIAAIFPASSQPKRSDINPPFEIPVAKTRFGSALRVAIK